MNWTDPKPPTTGISHYDHIICATPLGLFTIEWKSWKDSPDYGIDLNGEYIGTAYDLDEAKDLAKEHIVDMTNKLNAFLSHEPTEAQ